MRRLVFAPFILAFVLVGVSGLGGAQDTAGTEESLELVRVSVVNQDGEALERVEINRNARLVAQLRNQGNATRTGPISVEFRIQSEDGLVDKTQAITVNPPPMPVGSSTNVTYEYAPTHLGDHTLTVTLTKNRNETRSASFVVSGTAVVEADLYERFIQYGWFFAASAVTLVLFVAVVRVRKPGQ